MVHVHAKKVAMSPSVRLNTVQAQKMKHILDSLKNPIVELRSMMPCVCSLFDTVLAIPGILGLE